MVKMALLRALFAAALVFPPQAVAGEIPVPPLKTRVTDLTNTLTPDQRAALEAKLTTFETRKGSQVAVLMVPTTRPEEIEQYSIRVVEQWKIGRKRVDDGALLIVAKDDRKVRIEVGYGLEGALPDATAKRIVDEVIVPRFREGDFYGGITAGTDRILRVIEGEALPPPAAKKPQAGGGQFPWEGLFIAVIILTMMGGVLRSLFGRFLGSGIVGLAGGLLGYFLVGAFAALIVGAIAGALSLFGGTGARSRSGWGGGWGSGGGWSSGGGFGGGGGGFGGGGGGFGGGGASGSW